MKPAQTLISTVGTSLFFPNLQGLRTDDADPIQRALATAYTAREWSAVADGLAGLPANDRLCGAEMNSLASLFAKGYSDPRANLYFVHSATNDGREISKVLKRYYQRAGHSLVEIREVEDLQDSDPKRFRTKGLRNLAKVVCKIIRDHGPDSCAINATGGYKAQIAIAMLMGQALGVPVYYKHERFEEIIAFPPMPVSLDFQVWMRLSGLLFTLSREGFVFVPADLLDDQDRDGEVLESLVERTEIDARPYLELSPTGQIFHETFRERFHSQRDRVLPPAVPVSQKLLPALKDHAVINQHRDAIGRHLAGVTQQVPQVRRCATSWCSHDCPLPNRFRIHGDQIEGVFSDGSYAIKFLVETLATTDGQREAVVAALNEWLDGSCR